jgi:hypothetical protein
MDNIELNLENLTEEERKQLMKLIEKGNQKKSKVWEPNVGDTYCFVDVDGDVSDSLWDNDNTDYRRSLFGNVFRTQEEAEFESEKRKVNLDLQGFADENNDDGFDIFDSDSDKYYLEYDLDNQKLFVNCCFGRLFGNITYFSSEEIADKAIGFVGENRIEKYIFGVK